MADLSVPTQHNTTFRDGTSPQLEKLNSDTLKCPFCVKAGQYHAMIAHLQGHQRSVIKCGGYKVYKCHLGCVASSHYHCGFCPRIIVRKELFHNHFQKCCNQHTSASVVAGQSVAMPSSTSVPTPMATADVTTASDTAVAGAQATTPAICATTAVTVTAGSARTLGIARITAPVNADVVAAQMVSPEKASTTTEAATLVTAPERTTFVFRVPASARTYSKIVTSKDNKITCCLCDMQLLRKNLKMHLQRQHPSNIRRVLIHIPQRFTASANCLSE